ncbi:MAG: hypothetical protein HOU81_17480 [Hamadaea sp.]|uniref:hypothetical protein n=1 Tax=Hamadaea sp. TaxID=2024425 RepID=UPI0018443A38|nr:hypothetical protein [Hamadaea sp.]NUR72612.1 hypothetical protein [Hamadaea sp.]NUT23093.1 hypothetical protein [Hamadaea sp.]
MFTEPSTARQEAERLVAAALAVASLAAGNHPELATGSAACCVCPFCKLIEAVRDPDPQFVERLATGAGDLAVGLASLLRNLSGTREAADADPWRSATAEEPSPASSSSAASSGSAASGDSAAQAGSAASGGSASPTSPASRTTAKKVAKKAIAKKAVAPRKTSGKPAADQEEVPPKKAAPKKPAKKAMPRPRPDDNG